jgi:hypothetical protein
VTEAPTVQPFALGTNSKSVLTSLPNLCGPLTYLLTNGSTGSYVFLSLITAADPGSINVATNLISDVGTYPVQFEVYLTNYPLVTHVKINFTLTINNPCVNAVLNIPTPPADTTITALSGLTVVTPFNPATDSIALTSGLPDICGTRIHTLIEAIPNTFITVKEPVPPLNSNTNPWSLSLKTNLLT